MECRDVENLWEDWLGRGGSPLLERHLRECPRCRELASELARTSDWLSLLAQPPPEPGPAFWGRLRQRLQEREKGADIWTALGWAGARAAVALALLVLLLVVVVSRELPRSEVAEFDAPQIYLEDSPGSVPVTNGLSRDQVVLTLVAQTERSR